MTSYFLCACGSLTGSENFLYIITFQSWINFHKQFHCTKSFVKYITSFKATTNNQLEDQTTINNLLPSRLAVYSLVDWEIIIFFTSSKMAFTLKVQQNYYRYFIKQNVLTSDATECVFDRMWYMYACWQDVASGFGLILCLNLTLCL